MQAQLSNEEYNEITKISAGKIAFILSEFNDFEPQIRAELLRVTQSRVNRIMNGEQILIEAFTKIIEDVAPPEINSLSEDQENNGESL